MNKQCYICGLKAESKEHAPARCYFPDDSAYKKNLITVPSCKQHNENTSLDDEYVRNIIAMSFGTNPIAFNQFIAKTIESFIQSPGLLHTTTRNKKKVIVDNKDSFAFEIDRLRFNKVLRKISYALFFYVNKQPWNRELIVLTKNLYGENMQMDEFGELISEFEKHLPTENYSGHNPQVFKYAFGETGSNDPNECILRMIFYEGFHVWLSPVDGSTMPKIE